MFNTINNSIIEILGINTLPVEKQQEMMEKLGAFVYQEVMLRALERMSDEDKDGFEEIIQNNPDPEIMFTYLAEKIPNINDIVIEEATKLRDERMLQTSETGE